MLRHIRVASKDELKRRILAYLDDLNVSAKLTAHSMLRRDRTGMVSTIDEVDTTDERSLKPFET
jgi:hypothetical protein